MSTPSLTSSAAGDDAPLLNFSQCHVGILSHLNRFGELPALLDPAAKARAIAQETLAFFRDAVYEHHAEEERELFAAVLASAAPGQELARVKAITDQLVREHRHIEAVWSRLEPQLKLLARGQPTDVDVADIEQLVNHYRSHAAYEEETFLPLSHTILSRNSNHMAALGLSLHMRHMPPVMAHI